MKNGIPVFAAALLVAVALVVHAATPKPEPGPPGGLTVCAADGDPENLCAWTGNPGSQGRKCTLDVERIDRNRACNYNQTSAPAVADHKPMCFSVQRAEHIVFNSSGRRQFRVRRLIPITATNTNGQPCPAHPFTQQFRKESFSFDGPKDTLAPKASAIGCQYKLEVQWNAVDASAPVAPYDPQHRHLECRDPHLQIKSN